MDNKKEPQQKKPTLIERAKSNPWVIPLSAAAAVALALLVGVYLLIGSKQVYIDEATIVAPQIALGPTASAVLQEIYVKEGDHVSANETVARVGNELVKTKVAGLVIAIDDAVGTLVSPGTPVVTMIDPTALRVIGKLDEDKGLADVKVGQRAVFTVDAFGGRQFGGVVDEVAPTSRQSDIVFSISDQRAEQQFDVKVRFDVSEYSELKNGMSARVWIFK